MSIKIGTFLKDEGGDEFVITNIELFLHDGSPNMLQVFIYCQRIMSGGQICCITPDQIRQGIWEIVDDAEVMSKLKVEPKSTSKIKRDNKTKELFKHGDSTKSHRA